MPRFSATPPVYFNGAYFTLLWAWSDRGGVSVRLSTFGRGLLTQSVSAQIMAAVGTPETSVSINETTRRHKQRGDIVPLFVVAGGGVV